MKSSSETQGQMKGARESLNGRKYIYGTLFSPFFTFLRATFFRPLNLSLAPTICPWVSEDDVKYVVFMSLWPGTIKILISN